MAEVVAEDGDGDGNGDGDEVYRSRLEAAVGDRQPHDQAMANPTFLFTTRGNWRELRGKNRSKRNLDWIIGNSSLFYPTLTLLSALRLLLFSFGFGFSWFWVTSSIRTIRTRLEA